MRRFDRTRPIAPRRAGLASALLIAALAAAVPLAALEPINKTFFGGLALDGYDAVAYFEEGKAVEGDKAITVEWKEATWRFASVAHRDAFLAEPERYAPQYGGYCAWAVSRGDTADSDPLAWRIVDDKLYLNYSREVQKQWLQDVPGNIRKADANWPDLLAGK